MQVLLFYKEPDPDRYVWLDRYPRRWLRPLASKLTGKHVTSGFRVWFEALVKALEHAGHEVVVGDERLARKRPHHPIGLCGFTRVVDENRLPNPAVLGPGLYDHPKQAPGLLDDPRYRAYLVTCGWMRNLFACYYPAERLHLWHGAIDTDEWPDTRLDPKNVDLLVYDKVRFDRATQQPSFVEPILDVLRRRRLSFEVVRYGQYQHATYRSLLSRSRALLFLCESETQGMAYQEALACNVPVLAWDNGRWLDPRRLKYEAQDVAASSVPYFSEACGVRFKGLDDFEPQLERFLNGHFEPRDFVKRALSFDSSAEAYLKVYQSLL